MLLKLKGIIAKSWFFDILFFVDAGFHGYVLNVSNIRCSLSKVKCFKVVLHDGSNETALILYNSSLHGIFRKCIKHGQNCQDFRFQEQGRSIFWWKGCDFRRQTIHWIFKKADIIQQKEIMADIFVGELVNVIAFGSVESVLEEEISTKYEIKKKQY